MYWQRRSDGRVCIFETKGGKPKALPRDRTRHLDQQPDEVVERFIDSLAPRPPKPLSNEELTQHAETYCARMTHDGMSKTTVEMHRYALLSRIIPFFLSQDPPLTDPNGWPFRCARLYDHLVGLGISADLLIKCNAALSGLWNWLQDEGLVDASIKLRLRRPRQLAKETPLSFTVTPDEVLAWSVGREPDVAFMGLVGFFFSLRTQETLAVRAGDFLAGTKAAGIESGKVMARAGLFSKLAINVTKQHSKSSGDTAAAPKANSKGWVSCFDERAAVAIVGLVRTLKAEGREGPLVDFSVGCNLARWKQCGFPGLTLKDLRRASIYWLGHHTDLGLVELKSHARHERVETTAKYLRRPNEEVEAPDELDLEA